MDKGLIKIHELQQNLEELQAEKLQNEMQIEKLNNDDFSLEYNISDLGSRIVDLHNIKFHAEIAPERRKNEKKSTVIGWTVSLILCSLIASILSHMAYHEIILTIKVLCGSLVGSGVLASISIPLECRSINKKYPLGNLAQMEKDISSSNKQLANLKNKKKLNKEEIQKLESVKSSLEKQIQEVVDRISSISALRTKVIDEYCKDNPVLDKKLDSAYENEIESIQLQKVK